MLHLIGKQLCDFVATEIDKQDTSQAAIGAVPLPVYSLIATETNKRDTRQAATGAVPLPVYSLVDKSKKKVGKGLYRMGVEAIVLAIWVVAILDVYHWAKIVLRTSVAF